VLYGVPLLKRVSQNLSLDLGTDFVGSAGSKDTGLCHAAHNYSRIGGSKHDDGDDN